MPHRQNVYYASVINTLKLSAENAPNELRLVWLFEILVANIFNTNAGVDFINTNNICRYYPTYSVSVVNALGDYRNDFVHHGALGSYKAYLHLKCQCKEQIEALALEYDIEIDWSNTIYSKGV